MSMSTNGNGGSGVVPPNSPEAERGVLGCVLQESGLVTAALERFGSEEVFYDLRHGAVFGACKAVARDGQGIDLLTVSERLRAQGLLDSSGGLSGLAELTEAVPSTANFPSYLDIVWEKHLARKALGMARDMGRAVLDAGGVGEGLLGLWERRVAELSQQSASHLGLKPKNLQKAMEFGEEFFQRFFGGDQDELGWKLPFEFPMRTRLGEMSLMTGDNGSGKSSFIGQWVIVSCLQGAKSVVASMEVRPEVTLWIMARQLLGLKHLQDTEDGHREARRALEWLDKAVTLYNFLGITDWRDLLDAFRYSAKQHGSNLFVVDSVMRLGIEEDDYAAQALVAKVFADFAVKENVHVILVNHENKSDSSSAKQRISGTKKWSDNAHNVVGMQRNEAKANKVAELKASLETGEIQEKEYKEKLKMMRVQWDSKFILSKQRFPGSRQNGSRHLWFDFESLQFLERADARAWRYLE